MSQNTPQVTGLKVLDAGVTILNPALAMDFTGGGVTATDGGNAKASVSIPGGLASAILTATGTIDDSNTAFAFTSLPSAIVINGALYQQTGGAITWSWNAGTKTATLSQPVGVNGTIFGIL